MDQHTGQIVASALTSRDVDDGAQTGPLLDQVRGPLASFTGDGAYDQDASPPALPSVIPKRPLSCPARDRRAQRHGRDLPHERDRHLQFIAKHGRIAWQKASGYTARARAEAAMGRFKRVIGDGLRSRTDERRITEVEVAVHALNRMLELGRSNYVRVA